MQDIQERFLEVGLGIARNIGCLCNCNPHVLFALGSGANAPFLDRDGFAAQVGRRRRAHPYLGVTRGAVAPRCSSTLRKTMVGPPRSPRRRLRAGGRWGPTFAAAGRWNFSMASGPEGVTAKLHGRTTHALHGAGHLRCASLAFPNASVVSCHFPRRCRPYPLSRP